MASIFTERSPLPLSVAALLRSRPSSLHFVEAFLLWGLLGHQTPSIPNRSRTSKEGEGEGSTKATKQRGKNMYISEACVFLSLQGIYSERLFLDLCIAAMQKKGATQPNRSASTIPNHLKSRRCQLMLLLHSCLRVACSTRPGLE